MKNQLLLILPGNLEYRIHQGRTDVTILDLLMKLQKAEPHICVRYSCGHGICGSCAIKINGEKRLACKTKISQVEKPIRLEPIKSDSVNLASNQEGFFNEIKQVVPTKFGQALDAEERNCIFCGICKDGCQASKYNPEFLNPSAYYHAKRIAENLSPNDKKHYLKSLKSVWHCINMYNCIELCPKELNPSEAINALSREQNKIGNTSGHAKTFEENIKTLGRLYEPYLFFRSLFPNIKELLIMLTKYSMAGKVPPIIPKTNRIHKKKKDKNKDKTNKHVKGKVPPQAKNKNKK